MSDRAYAKVQTQQKTLTGSSPSSLLQRTCACGGSPGIDGLCTECRDKRLTLQSSRRGFEAPSVPTAAQGNSPARENVTSNVVDKSSRFGRDFSRIPVYSSRLPVLQTKLQVNQPGDVYEQKADQVAEQVMRMNDLEPPVSDDEDETKNSLMRKQRAEPGADAATRSPDVPPIVHTVLSSGGGQPLDTTTRAFMEPRFGHDFSQVRVHTDGQAAVSARTINALAYTVGRDVVFGAGQYAPRTSVGQRLLAHELTHVVQQKNREALENRYGNLMMSSPTDIAEQEADELAARLIEGPATNVAHILRPSAVTWLQRQDAGTPQKAPDAGVPQNTPKEKHGQYRVQGLGGMILIARKQAILSSGGNALDMAVAMLETETMQANYKYGDGKTGDSANFGIFKQNWFMIRTSSNKYASLTAKDYNVGAQLNASLKWDIEVLHTSQQKYGIDKWFAGHRNGETGVKNSGTADINTYKNAVYWIRDQINSDPTKYLRDDTRFYVQVGAI